MKVLNIFKKISLKNVKYLNSLTSFKQSFKIKGIVKINQFNFTDLSKNNEQKFSESEAMEIIEAGVFEVLKTAAKCKHDKLSRAASFKDLGFDSLDQVELVVALEEKFNINISGKYLFKYNHIR
jgi:acyl carrier protein